MMAVSVLNPKRFYRMDTTAPFEEDFTHEFKAHINISIQEVPHWAYDSGGGQSRAAVSKAICAFLNSQAGGTIYCGILDDGRIQGLSKTQYQLDHLKLSLQDVLSRYTPPIAAGRVSIAFVPVVDEDCDAERIQQILSLRQSTDRERRNQPHELRERTFKCWCVQDAKAQMANNPEQPLYIIEIIVHPWDPARGEEWGGVGQMKALPLCQDECGRAYARCQATVVSYSPRDVQSFAQQATQKYYEPKIKELKRELYELRLAAEKKAAKKEKS